MFILFIIYFFQASNTSRKKIIQKAHTARTSIVEATQYKQALPEQFWANQVMVVMFICARGHAPYVARGRKTLQMHGFPI